MILKWRHCIMSLSHLNFCFGQNCSKILETQRQNFLYLIVTSIYLTQSYIGHIVHNCWTIQSISHQKKIGLPDIVNFFFFNMKYQDTPLWNSKLCKYLMFFQRISIFFSKEHVCYKSQTMFWYIFYASSI